MAKDVQCRGTGQPTEATALPDWSWCLFNPESNKKQNWQISPSVCLIPAVGVPGSEVKEEAEAGAFWRIY